MTLATESKAGERPSLDQEFASVMGELDAFVKARSAAPTGAEQILSKAIDPPPGEDTGKPKLTEEEEELARLEAEKDKTKPMVKAIEPPLDGPQVVDGEEVIARFETLMTKSFGIIGKALGSMRSQNNEAVSVLAKALQVQGKALHALSEEVAALGAQGRPRKSVLSLVEKSVSGGGAPGQEKPDPDALMAKAVAASGQGRITPSDVGVVRMHLAQGLPIPSHLDRAINQ